MTKPAVVFLVLLFVCSVSHAQDLASISKARIDAANAEVNQAEHDLQNAEANHQTAKERRNVASRVANAARAEVTKYETLSRDTRNKIENAAPSKKQTLSDLADGYQQQAASRMTLWKASLRDHESAIQLLDNARAGASAARDALDDAIARRIEVRREIAELFKKTMPPHLAEVRVFGEEGVVYHGVWIPKRDEVHKRMAAFGAIIYRLPIVATQIESYREILRDQSARASTKADDALARYSALADAMGVKMGAAQVGESAFKVARSTRSGGWGGAVRQGIVESAKALRARSESRDFWRAQRLPGLNSNLREDLGIIQNDEDLGFEREAISRLEKLVSDKASAESTINKEKVAAAQRAAEADDPQILWQYSREIALDSAAKAERMFSIEELEAASHGPNERLHDIIRGAVGGSLETRKKDFERRVTGTGIYVELAEAKALGDRKFWPLHDAYREYMEHWIELVRLENERIFTTRDALALKRAQIIAAQEYDRLLSIEGSERKRARAQDWPVNTTLDSDTDYGIDLVFSTPVEVVSVTIGGVPVVVQSSGDGTVWTGGFDTEKLSGESPLLVEAHDLLVEKHRLDIPYTAPIWSTEENEFLDYSPVTDHYHKLQILDSNGDTGITVGIADMFGVEGLRILPTTGIKIRVFDEDGEEVAMTTSANQFMADFMPLEPATYMLRLDIGRYEPALPPDCTKGYVREFKLEKGDRLQFTASVYTASRATNGTTVGKVVGECIKLKAR